MRIELDDSLSITGQTLAWPKELIDALVPDVKVIYSDIDGTLLGPGGCLFKDAGHGFTSVPALAILQCHMNNIDIVPVSGRNNEQLYSDSRILGFNNWIAELGCQIVYNKGELLLLNVGDFLLTCDTVWQSILDSGAPDFLFREFEGKLEYHEPWSQKRECTHLLRGFIDIDSANAKLSANGFDSLCVIDNGRVRRRSQFLDPSIVDVHAYHLLPRASSKASAVQKDMKTRSIQKNQAIAIGDSPADLALADEVGVLFLVKNAVLESPQLIDRIRNCKNIFVTTEEMGLGWAEVVQYIVGRWL